MSQEMWAVSRRWKGEDTDSPLESLERNTDLPIARFVAQ